MIFNRALAKIKDNMHNEINCIPWGLERFENVVPGIMQKKYYLVTANSGVGKTQFTDSYFMYRPVDFILNTETDIKLKVFYYSLEIDKESKIIQGIAKKIYTDKGLVIPHNKILSMNKHRISEEEFKIISETKDYFEKLEDYVYIYDDIINPYGIFKQLVDYAKSHGTIHTKKITKKLKNEVTGVIEEEEIEIFDYYEPFNPKEYVIIIVDHAALLNPEKGLSTKLTIEKHSNNMVKLRNMFGYIPVLVQQQAAAMEELDTYKGQTLESKLIPSLYGLGETKLTGRDCDIALGVFSPARYELDSFRGYNISLLQDNFRSLHVLKYRSGSPNGVVGLYFNGAVNYFDELPKPKTPELQEIYNYIRSNKQNQ
jgi:replicative DNA helicase